MSEPVVAAADAALAPERAATPAGELVPVVDQGVSSASNFLLSTLVARASTPAEFATFTVAYTGYVVLQGVARAGLYLRLLARPHTAETRAALPRVLQQVTLAALGVGLPAALVFAILGSGLPAIALCGFLPVLLLQDGQRFAAFVCRRDTDALVSDSVWLVATALIAGSLFAATGHVSAGGAALAWVSGGVAGVAVLVARRRYVPRRVGPQVREWIRGRAIIAGSSEFLVAAAVTYGVPLLAAAGYGAGGVSAVRASIVFYSPCLAFLQGLHAPVIRTLARTAASERRRVQHRLAGATLAVVLSVTLVMYALRGTIGPLLLGSLWRTTAPLVLPAVLFVAARFIELTVYGVGRVTAQMDRVLKVRGATSAVTVLAFVAPMAAGASLLFSFWCFSITALLVAAGSQLVSWSDG